MIYTSGGTLVMLWQNTSGVVRNETSTLENIYSDTFVNTFISVRKQKRDRNV